MVVRVVCQKGSTQISLTRSLMIRILLGLGLVPLLVLEGYAILPGETALVPKPTPKPVKKVSHNESAEAVPKEAPEISRKEVSKVNFGEASKRLHSKIETPPLPESKPPMS
jgi:hypothetical protein